MADSTRPVVNDNQKKPHPDYPLTSRGDGRWCKKIRGKMHYFTGTSQEALDEWLRVKDDLLAGRTPRAKGSPAGFCVGDLCNHFLNFKRQMLDSGELAPRTFDRYKATCEFLVAELGRNRPVDALAADDFQGLRATMAHRWGPVALGNEIQMVRSVFRYGQEAGLLAKAVLFGPGFKKPSAKVLRAERSAGGPKAFTSKQIQDLLKVAGVNMKAMLLLAINGGLGNGDLGAVPVKAFDLEGGWLSFPRPKTGIDRRIPLWPETVAAVREVIEKRREPTDASYSRLLFICDDGGPYVPEGDTSWRVSDEFARVAKAAGIEGRAFYDLRRTFQTIGEGAHDLVAVKAIMGHAAAGNDMSATYRQFVEDARLLAVTSCVRAWLWPKEEKAPTKPKAAKSEAKPRATKRASKKAASEPQALLRIVG